LDPISLLEESATPHNLGLYRLEGFSGSRHQLLTLHDWLTGGDDLPAIAISGEQGMGKSTLATAVAWNHFHHFRDGIIRVSPAGTNPFRLYDVVRTLDSVLGTALTRISDDRWGIGILEQLYKRKRLLIIDKLAGGTPHELSTLVSIIGHLHENEGQSRIVLIDRNFSPAIASLVQGQHIHLNGFDVADVPEFIRKRAPAQVRDAALRHVDDLHSLTCGSPLCMRFALGLMIDFPWEELAGILRGWSELNVANPDQVSPHALCSFAVENYALQNPQAIVLLSRMVHGVGGITVSALSSLFWDDLGTSAELQTTLESLAERGLLEMDRLNERAYIHPIVRRYLNENAVMLGEEWDRRHAAFYVTRVQQYQKLPLQRWPEVDKDWGNIFVGADWCARRVERLFGHSALEIIADPDTDPAALAQIVAGQAGPLPGSPPLSESLPLPGSLPSAGQLAVTDLRLARTYALALADYAFWRHPPGIVRWLAVGALAALAMQDLRNYAWFLMNIGRQMFFLGRLQEAIAWLDRARPIFDQHDLLSDLAYLYTDLGTTYRVLDEPRRALESFKAAFDCTAQLSDQPALATAYMNLGSAYFSLNQHEQALAEHAKALRVALRLQDKHLTASAFNNMGLALESTERYEDAVHAYEHALRMFRQLDDATGISACYNNLGSVCFARGETVNALQWYDRDRQLLEQRGAWTDLAATLHNLGHVALEQGARDQAEAYFTQSRDLYAAFDLHEYVGEEEEMLRFLADNKRSANDKRNPAKR
jgi:tetratricopeptide (TPR) repeat protein